MSETYVVLDFETTGFSPKRDQIIEIGAIRIENGIITDTFHTLIQPGCKIPQVISDLTGIRDEDLSEAPGIEDVLPDLLRFLDGAVVVAHNASFDLGFLNHTLEENGYLPYSGWYIDTAELAQILWPRETSYALEALSRNHGLHHERPHRALSDAKVTAEIFLRLMNRGKELPLLVLQQICALMEAAGWELYPLFAKWMEDPLKLQRADVPEDCSVIEQLMHRVVEVPENDRKEGETSDSFNQDQVVQILANGGPLSRLYDHYEERPAQLSMIRMVARAFQERKHGMIEAGTGTGKSLAYLVPAIYYAKTSGQRVIVATHTINLQEQLKERDIPLLKKILDFPFEISVFKGRNNYVCMRKVATGINSLGLMDDREERKFFLRMLTWLIETEAGDREELTLYGQQAEHWHRVMSDANSCINKQCPWFKNCYYHKAKARAQQSDVVITNHSLIFTDIKAEHNVLPGFTHLVIDEAHHLEDEATRHLGDEANYFQLTGALNRLARDHKNGLLVQLQKYILSEGEGSMFSSLLGPIERMREQVSVVRTHVEELFRLIHTFTLQHASNQDAGRFVLRIRGEFVEKEEWEGILSAFSNFQTEVTTLRNTMKKLEDQLDDLPTDDLIIGMVTDITGQVREVDRQWSTMAKFFKGAGEEQNAVLWIEAEEKSTRPVAYLYTAPIHVGPLLHEFLYNKKESVVLTSATLTVNQTFKYVADRLGLTASEENGRLLTLALESPFDYKKQALLCVPSDVMPVRDVPEESFVASLSESITALARISQGRMLVLFTSHRMLRDTYLLVKPKLAEHGIQLYAHGIDSSSRHRLVAEFQRHPRAVLFGANSFWEGVDIPGEDLSCLVIVRLPFWPPNHPVVAARTEALEAAGKNAFMSYSVPQAIVRFKQGFGRLIRSKRDVGAIVVYDRRIIDARYGRHFIRSLPGPWFYQGTEREIWKVIYNWLKKKEVESHEH
ncbi:DNA polymerase III subunit epsilon [Collibacillus ludicampi]|uniref:3'-5' exonuclease DinG n=1 Tax=Collibacillus ludicampi TaxID=2771369 RepID=A0AAV4LJW8_9BACL|nr:ATP-dependent DNA helicase DinG [Collibacillus ludicampi]GIM48146.1 DNA polymerase III subunit epsilon [Collibacillus ludicampi]